VPQTERRQDLVGQRGQIFPAPAQGGQLQGDHVQPVEEVLTKAPRADLFPEVAAGCGDDPRAHGDRLAAADPLESALLEEAEQLPLKLGRQLADLVEERRAALGGFQASRLVPPGTREGTPDVPEELALEEMLGEATTPERAA